MLPVAVARSSSDSNAIFYVGLLPVLWMTLCFHILNRTGRIKDDAYYVSSSLPYGGTSRIQTTLFGRDRQVAALKMKYAVSDCMLFSHEV